MSSVLSVPSTVTLLNVTSSVVPIACQLQMSLYQKPRTVVVTPVPPSNSSVSVPGLVHQEPLSPVMFERNQLFAVRCNEACLVKCGTVFHHHELEIVTAVLSSVKVAVSGVTEVIPVPPAIVSVSVPISIVSGPLSPATVICGWCSCCNCCYRFRVNSGKNRCTCTILSCCNTTIC